MRSAFALIFVLVAAPAWAGKKATFTVAFDGEPQFTYVASVLDDGEVVALSPGLRVLSGTATVQLSGHAEIRLLSVSSKSAEFEFKAWDRMGLATTSPRYKAFFSTRQRIHPGYRQLIRFTQGDASIEGGWVDHTVRLKLEKLEHCDDRRDCGPTDNN